MTEWWLLIALGILSILATCGLIYPLWKNSKLSLVLSAAILVSLFLGYASWGDFTSFQKHLQNQNNKILAQKMMKSFKNPQDLINQLKAKLKDTAESAKGWYLLGRIYTSQNQQNKAIEAFSKAHRLKPKNEQFSVYYAHSLWTANQQKFNPEIVGIFEDLLKNNPNQTDALAMLAMNAFLSKDTKKAIKYWQRLLTLVPKGSEEEMFLRKSIARAQNSLIENKMGL